MLRRNLSKNTNSEKNLKRLKKLKISLIQNPTTRGEYQVGLTTMMMKMKMMLISSEVRKRRSHGMTLNSREMTTKVTTATNAGMTMKNIRFSEILILTLKI